MIKESDGKRQRQKFNFLEESKELLYLRKFVTLS